jgi:uncharacterized damage-inducible protein DinB
VNESTKSLGDIYALNSKLIRLGLEDLSQEDASRRTRGGQGSSISYLVGHLLASRIAALRMLGKAEGNPYSQQFGGGTAASDGADYPSVADLAHQWDEVATRFATALEGLSHEDVLAAHEGFPVPDQTVRGALMFRAWHESYHVGQIGMIRTELGYPALRDRLLAEGRKTS